MKKKEKNFFYPDIQNCACKTFQIKYNGKLSPTLKFLLTSFQKKYFYHVVDDILYLLNLSSKERKCVLALIISPALVLQNYFSVNFLELWICDIYINEASKPNRFLGKKNQNFSYITIKFLYITKLFSYRKNFYGKIKTN